MPGSSSMDKGQDPLVQSAQLADVRVCFLRENNYAIDARTRKQAASLASRGAAISLVGIGHDVPEDLASSGYDMRIMSPPGPPQLPRLGRHDVWWPLRVMVNLTFTKMRQSLYSRRQARSALRVFRHEELLVDAATRVRPDVVHAHNLHTLPAALRIKRKTGARVVYDCRDLFTEVDYINDATREKFRRVESKLISSVDATITVSELLAEALSSKYGVQPTVIYNGPACRTDHAAAAHTPVRLLFQGAFTENRNLLTLVMAMPTLKGRAVLTLQGFGGIEALLREQVALLGLYDTVVFRPPVEPLRVVDSATEHDVGVICHLGTNVNMRSAVPNKLMDYLGAGLAVAASDLPGHRSILEGTGAGVFLDPSTPDTLASGLEALLDDPERMAEMKRAAVLLSREYEWPVQEQRLLDVYARVLAAKRSRYGLRTKR